ncbi:MAG: alkaline phosphatase family protein [Roseibacillus sp.]|nr:alkaline phosphatase family protein [Roseibacillus sp.]
MKSLFNTGWAALFLLLPCPPLTAAPDGTVGPLVGSVTPTSAKIWFYAPAEARCELFASPDAAKVFDTPVKFVPIQKPAGKISGAFQIATLRDLTPATLYHYGVKLDGKPTKTPQGSFHTPPQPGTPHKLRMVLTSCMRIGQPQESWNLLRAEKPHLHLTVGDTHYADTTDPTRQWEHHLRYRQVPEFAAVIRNIPTYAMWDDHDYGPNNSDGTAPGKKHSLAGWKQVWANPPAGTATTPGAFFRFSWGEVDFFVVDGRYHRSPDKAPDDARKRMLGDAQFNWLLEGLKSSEAKFKVIASGSTLDHSKGDGWKIYTFSRHRLFDAIKANRINGVVYMSGDIHNSLVWQHPESNRVGYPLVEVISSGVANSKNLSFAAVDFDTTGNDPFMRVRIIMGDKNVAIDRTWKLSQISHK